MSNNGCNEIDKNINDGYLITDNDECNEINIDVNDGCNEYFHHNTLFNSEF